ncbi:MAG: ribulose-phosphate 3-epimerase [Rickettsiaceae bacterium H1]|nr:ribulose-phosphate 3-epimerase [Rickettsiaceae bacterium H1]
MVTVKIAASILSADFSQLGQEIRNVTQAGANYIHVDVMDGHFVPNITIGSCVIKSIRKQTHLPFDVHLMISPALNYIEDFANAGSDIITIHEEAEIHLEKAIRTIKSLGKKAGISIVPSTNPEILKYLLDEIDLILVMSVNPGFGGQQFLSSQLQKIANIRLMINKSNNKILLGVDGGINEKNAQSVIKAGADILVAGSAIFTKNGNYKENIQKLRN